MSEWTFVTNRALVFSFLAKHPRITARDVSAATGITERATRKIVADLDEVGYITKRREEGRIRHRINSRLLLRHKTHRDAAVGELPKVQGWKEHRIRHHGGEG